MPGFEAGASFLQVAPPFSPAIKSSSYMVSIELLPIGVAAFVEDVPIRTEIIRRSDHDSVIAQSC